jgi:hypothetical protein
MPLLAGITSLASKGLSLIPKDKARGNRGGVKGGQVQGDRGHDADGGAGGGEGQAAMVVEMQYEITRLKSALLESTCQLEELRNELMEEIALSGEGIERSRGDSINSDPDSRGSVPGPTISADSERAAGGASDDGEEELRGSVSSSGGKPPHHADYAVEKATMLATAAVDKKAAVDVVKNKLGVVVKQYKKLKLEHQALAAEKLAVEAERAASEEEVRGLRSEVADLKALATVLQSRESDASEGLEETQAKCDMLEEANATQQELIDRLQANVKSLLGQGQADAAIRRGEAMQSQEALSIAQGKVLALEQEANILRDDRLMLSKELEELQETSIPSDQQDKFMSRLAFLKRYSMELTMEVEGLCMPFVVADQASLVGHDDKLSSGGSFATPVDHPTPAGLVSAVAGSDAGRATSAQFAINSDGHGGILWLSRNAVIFTSVANGYACEHISIRDVQRVERAEIALCFETGVIVHTRSGDLASRMPV